MGSIGRVGITMAVYCLGKWAVLAGYVLQWLYIVWASGLYWQGRYYNDCRLSGQVGCIGRVGITMAVDCLGKWAVLAG